MQSVSNYPQSIPLTARALAVVLCAVILWACDAVVQSSDRITATDASPAQEKLAAMQTGSRTVSRSLVAAFDRTLTRLEGKCRQSRTSSLSLGDMAVSASRMAKQSDRSLTLLEALEAIDKSIPDDAPTKLGKLDCVDIIGLVLTTMGVKAPK